MIPVDQDTSMKIKVLAVDNNPVLLKAVSTILKQEGCEVSEAGTGLDALEILDHFVPDILFTDLIMPRVSGEQLCRVVRSSKKYKDVFIVVLSAIVIEDRDRILEDVACDLCIAKGNLKEIRSQIKDALEAYHNRNNALGGSGMNTPRIPEGLKPSEVTGELLLEKQHQNEILSNLNEGILELTQHGKIVTVNRSACKILGCSEEKLTGIRLLEARDWGGFTPLISRWTDEDLGKGGMQSFHIFEDSPLHINSKVVTASFIPVIENGSIFGLCIFRDITRQHQAEQHNKELDDAIKLAKKMDAMSCMAGGMAHDFNNLLTVICGNLDIISLQNTKHDPEASAKLISQAQKAALIAVDLTRQISCFSNFGIVSRKKENLYALVTDTIKKYFSENGGQYNLIMDADDCVVSIDAEEISTAIYNVLQNAQESSENRKINVSVSEIKLTGPEIISGQYIPAGSYGKIDIKDSGSGIDKDELFKVFDPYYSTKERGIVKGMGLGLTIVYATLRNHGGYVVVGPAEADGTVVSLYLPVFISKDRDGEGGGIMSCIQTILLVEPDIQMREIGSIMLSHLGYKVIGVSNSTEATVELQRVENNVDEKPGLVILDVSGINKESPSDCCRIFKQTIPEIQVIAMSGTILDPTMENCKEYGFANSLSKPYTMDGLRHVVNSVLYV
ncbi:MAG: two-component system cell cycle sensor histidine kinase/response regulator CckA [Desulforhopalus sp.]|jgi:two-component system cell cycle sensor histidine kinase/response regulator CckA